MKKIILLGQAIVDDLCKIDFNLFQRHCINQNKFNRAEFDTIESLVGSSEVMYRDIGGCATNTAIGLNELGEECELVFVVGDDGFGEFYQDRLKSYRNIHPRFSLGKRHTGRVVTFTDAVDDNTPRTSVYNHGCSNDIRLNSWLENALVGDAVLYLSLFSFFEEDSTDLYNILGLAKGRGLKVVMDAGGVRGIDAKKLNRILPFTRGVLANIHELKDIQAKTGEVVAELTRDRWYIVKDGLGPTKIYLYGRLDGSVLPPRCSKVVNCLGAGDAFASAFIKEFVYTGNLLKATELGNEYAQRIIMRKEFH